LVKHKYNNQGTTQKNTNKLLNKSRFSLPSMTSGWEMDWVYSTLGPHGAPEYVHRCKCETVSA